MTGAITWEFVTAIGGVLGVLLGLWRYLEARIIRAELAAQEIRKDLEQRLALLNSTISAVQLMSAEKYASRDVVKETEERIVSELERMRDSLDRLSARVDNVMHSRGPVKQLGA
ncbi:hypothetical protein [Rhodoligotrophos ferricapiens]|uniref:hypothetical protein n=1 Tax=Rhodoligotrophos ferricapiens TaxID=3069264 RepID=UPI00315D037D